MKGKSAADRAHQRCSVELRLGDAVPVTGLDNLRDRLFVGILGQQNERYRYSRVQKLRHQTYRFRVSGFMFEQNKPVRLLLNHGLRFFQGPRLLKICTQDLAVALEYLADQEEVFLPLADQENSQRSGSRFCGSKHRNSLRN